jgi:3-dehydroquinate dehydratase-2
MKILVINGPNLNFLGIRQPEIYGDTNYQALCQMIEAHAAQKNIEITIFQSNHEGAIVDEIQAAYQKFDGIVINPAAYTHTSIAILDALKSVMIPAVEVHISDINGREPFRQISYAGLACFEHVIGQGLKGYLKAIDLLAEHLAANKK